MSARHVVTPARALGAAALSLTLVAASLPVSAGTAHAAPAAPLTNLAHLDSLLAEVPLLDVPGHSTYQQDTDATALVPWTYADHRPDGAFNNVGGGSLDPATGHWSQGAYNTDDITRTAVVYLRHWQQTGTETSRDTAADLLRSVMYMQTTEGPDAGNSVLWLQPDGVLNPSAEPVELPDPSDSAESYWVARTVWALGEGYAAFHDTDPAFAAYIKERLHLSLDALQRQSLSHYGEWDQADGVAVPAWLIGNGADASAEAVLGLAAYSAADPGDSVARTALRQYSEGIAAMASGDITHWPFGALLPWTLSQSMWHAWGGMPPAALATAGTVLGDASLIAPAVADTAQFTAQLLASGGADNAWGPGFTEPAQIAYGVDSRVQGLLSVAEATDAEGLRETAALAASWYFGANRGDQPMYNPANGVTFDGLSPEGVPNRNSGAESTIHGLLSMLALDAHPAVKAAALATPSAVSHSGLSTVEAETATGGTAVTPPSSWTGESSISGGAYLLLADGETASITIPASDEPRRLYPIVNRAEAARGTSAWSAGTRALGTTDNGGVGDRGITEAPGQLKPLTLDEVLPAGATSVTVTASGGPAQIDALLLQPLVSTVEIAGAATRAAYFVSAATEAETRSIDVYTDQSVRSYDAQGRAVATGRAAGQTATITIEPGGFAVVHSSLTRAAEPTTSPTAPTTPGTGTGGSGSGDAGDHGAAGDGSGGDGSADPSGGLATTGALDSSWMALAALLMAGTGILLAARGRAKRSAVGASRT